MLMKKTMIAVFAASVFLTGLAGCVSSPESQAGRPPNYVITSQNTMPAIRNDKFGGTAMPMRGLPH